jgi:hypothetical protein
MMINLAHIIKMYEVNSTFQVRTKNYEQQYIRTILR